MTARIANPAAARLLIGWLILGALTLGALMAMGFMPPHPGFNTVFIPACVALLAQGITAMMAARRGHARLGWLVLLVPQGLLLLLVLAFFVLFAIGIS